MPSTESKSNHFLKTIHPSPNEAYKIPYAPAIQIVGACDLMFISGCTASTLYHHHPHRDEEHIHPHSMEEQTKMAMESIKMILDNVGATFKDIVKITKYLTDMRESDIMNKAMMPFMDGWQPASTMICINQLSSPGARIELDCIVAIPKKT
ncbi:MAG: RidA family protein [Pseudolabrys sp.]|nr:RidA family protein [Pseudolabrys sp.]